MFDLSGIAEDQWRLLEVSGIWFAGFMTFCAVTISLFLAIHTTKPKLKMHGGARIIFGEGPEENVVSVNVANIGATPVVVKSQGWQLGFLKKAYLYQNPGPIGLSQRLPARVEIGDSINLYVTYEYQEPYWIDKFSRIVLEQVRLYQPLWLVLWSIKATISTATGHTFMARMDSAFRRDIRERIERIKDSESEK